jgi:hypothetical protein
VPVWTFGNALALLFALRLLPFSTRSQSMLALFVLLELLTSLQNSQSNGLMAGLFIAAWACMQKGKVHWAALWLVVATFIKVYGAVGFCIFLFYPGKLRFTAWTIAWSLFFAFIPLLVTPFSTLIWQYHNWMVMMGEDQSVSYGLSVMGWLHSWFGLNSGKTIVSISGILLFLIPFARYNLYKEELYKILILAFMLIWVIIFNHKAESPTFIIAVIGVGIWYFAMPRTIWRRVMLAAVFIFTIMSPSDLFPPFIRQNLFQPYTIKAVPCIIVWCIVFIDLMTLKKGSGNEPLPTTKSL